MQDFRLGTRAYHIDRAKYWANTLSSLVKNKFGKPELDNLAVKQSLGRVSDEPRLTAVNNLLSRGLPVEDLSHLRDSVDPQLYSEAFKAGVHPQDLNRAIDVHGLSSTRDERRESDQGFLNYHVQHGGLEDFVGSLKSGATTRETLDALGKLNGLDTTLSRQYDPVLKKLHKEDPSQPSSLPLQHRVVTVQPMSERVFRRMGYSEDTGVQEYGGEVPTLRPDASWEEIEQNPEYSAIQNTAEDPKAKSDVDKINSFLKTRKEEGYDPIESLYKVDEVEEARKRAKHVTSYHPLRSYSYFRRVPGSTHQEFLDALDTCHNKWNNLAVKTDPSLTIPHLLNTFSHLRLSGATQEEAHQVIRESSPQTCKLLQKFSASVPFRELKPAWDLAQDAQAKVTTNSDPLLHVKLLSKYLGSRIMDGKGHEEALKQTFFYPDMEQPTTRRTKKTPFTPPSSGLFGVKPPQN